MIEVEVKARAGADVLRTLEARGDLVEDVVQRDLYLQHPSRDLAVTDEALRLRTAGGGAELTYKGPRLDPATKTRREIDVPVTDDEAARALLEALGFDAVGEVVKRRRSFRLAGWHVSYDEVEGLGAFLEVERVVDDDADVEALGQAARGIAQELGAGEMERSSYLELLLRSGGA